MFIVIYILWLYFQMDGVDGAELKFLPPNVPVYPSVVEGTINMHLTKMSSELFRDATMKMRTVRSYAELHKENPQYVIGTMVVNILALFDKMATVYQQTCSLQKTRHNGNYDDNVILARTVESVSAVQGLFHQIRLERRLFEDVLEDIAEDARKKKAENEKRHGVADAGAQTIPVPEKKKGGMYVDRRFNVAPLFNEDDFDSNFELPILSKRKNKEKQITHKPVAEHLPKNPYVPLPLKEQESEFDQQMDDISKMLPKNFRRLPSNSSAMKIIRQLNKDHPDLNPDLDTYFARYRRGNRVKISTSANYRRMGSDTYAPGQARKGSNSSVQRRINPDIKSTYRPKNDRVTQKTQPFKKPESSPSIQTRKLDSGRYTPAWPLKQFRGDQITANSNGRNSLTKRKQLPNLELSRNNSESRRPAGNHTLSSKQTSGTQPVTNGIPPLPKDFNPLTLHNINNGRRFFNNQWRKKKTRSPIWKPKEIY